MSAATAERASRPAEARAPSTATRQAEPAAAPSALAIPSLSQSIQAKRFVSSPDDAAEREADKVAKQVVTMPEPVRDRSPPLVARSPLQAQRAPGAAALRAPPASASQAANDAKVQGEVKAAATGGAPLSRKTRAFLEPRFRANFAGVGIHTDSTAVRLSNQIGAKAFTYGRHIFFNSGQYNPDTRDGMELLAHELTHTIQQSETIQRKAAEPEPEAPRVQERTGPQASRLGISDVLDYFADAANAIPGFRMFTILIGVNPINMSAVEASAANILRAIVEFLPGGNIITRVLDSYGVFDKVGGWIEAQLKSLGITGPAIKAAVTQFIDSLGWRDIFHLGDVWNRAKAIFTTPITRIIEFAKSLFSKILEFVREAVLRPLAALAASTPFYPLLKAVLGKDPVTGEPVQGGAAEVIGGFMTMIGQQELWGNIQRANAIPRAWTWFQTAMKGLLGIVTSIPTRFMDGLRSLEIMDFVVLPRAFAKIGAVLGSFLSDFGSWALGTIFDLLKIIMEVVAPGVMPYIYKAGAAFRTIIKDPVRFVKTLVRAAIQGFGQFATNFLTHLQASLVGWLTGAMAGANVYVPRGLNPLELLKFVLSILGLTWQNVRGKLVRATNESTVVALETGFQIVKTLVTEGPAAAWQEIVKTLTNLKQMAIDAIMDFVKSKVVQAAVTKLLSMLSPAGALIQAILAIYNTVMFFVERLKQIAAVAASFIDAIATIASGNVGPAANRVESTMAGLLTLVISFLARIAGLGKVSDAVKTLIDRIRAPINTALDKVVDWIVAQAKKLGRFILQAGTPADPNARLQLAIKAAQSLVKGRKGGGKVSDAVLTGLFGAIKGRYGLTELVAYKEGKKWFVRGTINPTAKGELTPEEEEELLRTVRLYTDEEVAKRKPAPDAKRVGEGSHESPIIVPPGGIAAISHEVAASKAGLGKGKKDILDVSQDGSGSLRGGVQVPAFKRPGGDFNISGATPTERKVPVGTYPEIAEAMKNKFPDEQTAAKEMKDFLSGGPIPPSLAKDPGWAGGVKTLAGAEVVRDSVIVATLPAGLELVGAGKLKVDELLVHGGNFPANTQDPRRTGGLLSHSPLQAAANLRGVRTELAIPINPSGEVEGKKSMREGVKKGDLELLVKAAMARLNTKSMPPLEQIQAAVKAVVDDFMKKPAK